MDRNEILLIHGWAYKDMTIALLERADFDDFTHREDEQWHFWSAGSCL